MIALEVKKMKKNFGGVKAVDGLSLKFEKGQITSLIGPNGAGKSTMVNLMTAMYPPDAGKMIVHGVTLEKWKSYNMPTYGVTRTFQDVRLFEQMSVLDNVLVVLTERGVFRSLFETHGELHLKQAEEILKRVDLWKKRDEKAEDLSYGQRKLLEIGRAVAMDADIYFFDEPFAGLFKEMVKTVVSILHELKNNGKTILLIEHNMDLIRELSDHVIVVDAGKFFAEGEASDVLARKDVVEAYLGE
ncbi:ABC transporter ATP-binding protein [Candidatus Uhrbacteria bacterium]|jgi:branched-chain amino acid transport system ATP-binding protein|nr:ABC transporter ATP-binding protein [Candidatus Uhrbacteria bacterium]